MTLEKLMDSRMYSWTILLVAIKPLLLNSPRRSKVRFSQLKRSGVTKFMLLVTSCSAMVLVSSSTVTLTARHTSSLTPITVVKLNHVTRLERHGTGDSELSQPVLRSAALTLAVTIFKLCPKCILCSGSRLTRSIQCSGLTSWTNSERASLDWLCLTQRPINGVKHTLKALMSSPSTCTKTKRLKLSNLNWMRKSNSSSFTWMRRTWTKKAVNFWKTF